jgi:hypothetical protein
MQTVQEMFLLNIDADADNYLFVEGRAALRHGDGCLCAVLAAVVTGRWTD